MAILVKHDAISSSKSQLAAVRAEITRAATDCQEKELEIASFHRIAARRESDLKILRFTADRIEELSNQAALEIVEHPPHGSTVSRISIPTSSCRKQVRERVIIYVPPKLVAELEVRIFGNYSEPDIFEDFEEPERRSIPLVSGENFIDVAFDWDQVPNAFTVTNHTNGDSIAVRATGARKDNWFPSLGQAFYRLDLYSPKEGMTVFEGLLGNKKGARVVVQMVESEKQ